MELIRGEHNLRPRHHGCVATIGNFDGVHLGHQAVIAQLREQAARRGLPSMLVTFEPLPHEYFLGAAAAARLSPLRERLRRFAELGVDRVLLLRFDARLATRSAEDFVRGLLVERLGVQAVTVGDDFRFGKDRAGDFEQLTAAGRSHGFAVLRQRTFALGGDRVSSTRIRKALAAGDLAQAAALLGHPYTLSGRVRHGDARGRTIGFPTANLALPGGRAAVSGVFAVTVCSSEGLRARGVANIGRRPTVGGQQPQLEVHLFDFDGDLYGQHLGVELRHKIREERRFESFNALRRQIREDAEAAAALLAQDTQST